MTAAHYPIREILEKEKKVHNVVSAFDYPSQQGAVICFSVKWCLHWVAEFHCVQEKSLAKTEGRPEPALYGSEHIRPLSIDDFKSAHEQVRTPPSLPSLQTSTCISYLLPTFSTIYILVSRASTYYKSTNIHSCLSLQTYILVSGAASWSLPLPAAGLRERFIRLGKHERASPMERPVRRRWVEEEESAELLHVTARDIKPEGSQPRHKARRYRSCAILYSRHSTSPLPALNPARVFLLPPG